MKPIQVKCPGCGKVYAVSNPAVVGKSTKCKQCGSSFVIQPGEDEEAAPAKPAARAAATKPAPAAAAKPAARAAAPARTAAPPPPPDDDAGEDEEEEGEDYPDNEPTISVSAYEAQKLREQLRAGIMKAPDAGDGAPSAEDEPASAPAPTRPPPRGKAGGKPAQGGKAGGGGNNALLFVIIGLAVVLGGLAAAYFLLK